MEPSYYEDYRQSLMACPWGDDRTDLEQWAVITSWDNSRTARELLQFPDSAWVRPGTKLAVQAIRKILNEGGEPDPLMIAFTAKSIDPDNWLHVNYLRELYDENILNLAGLQKSAITLMRREYQWEAATKTLVQANSNIRQKDYSEWLKDLRNLVTSLTPGSSGTATVKRFSEVMHEEAAKRDDPEYKEKIKPVSTGFKDLDKVIIGFHPGDNVLLCGAPGHGKTTVAWQMLTNMSWAGHESYFLSCEMKRHKMVRRVYSQASSRPMRKLRDKDIEIALQASSVYKNIHFDDRICKIEHYLERVATWKYENKNGFAVCADHSGSIQSHGKKSIHEASNEVASDWYATAKDENIFLCSIMLQQPNNEYKRAQVPDLRFIRNTGLFEENADTVLWCHHPWAFDKTKDPTLLELWVLKNREGPTGVIIPLKWNRACFQVKDWIEPPKNGKTKADEEADKNRDQFAEQMTI